jgi:limonene-1,2-epoxide hydrolase
MRMRRGLDATAFTVTPEEAIASGAESTELGKMLVAHSCRPIYKWTHYLPAYEAEFGPYRDGFPVEDGSRRPLRMLEIGVYKGGSLQLWREYFGHDAIIFGIDIDPKCAEAQNEGIEVRIGSQDDPAFLASVIAEMGGVDVVLDDGSHVGAHQRASFETLFPLLSDGGVYAVEDLHTAYWRDYGGAYQGRGSFVELIKQLVDDMHSWYHTKGQRLPVDAAHTIPRISFYDSIAVIHKAQKSRPEAFYLDGGLGSMAVRHGQTTADGTA